MTEVPRRQASRSLADVIGPMTNEQAARILAVLHPYLYAPETTAQADTPDAA